MSAFVASAAAALWRDRHFSPQRVQAYAQRRLSRLLQHAAQNSPLYRQRLAGLDLARPDLAAIDPIDKAELMHRFADSVVGASTTLDEVQTFARQATQGPVLFKDRWIVLTTSGTTGRVGYFVIDLPSWRRQIGLLFARVLRERLTLFNVVRFGPWRPFRMGMVVATGGPFMSYYLSRFRSALTRLVSRSRTFSISADEENLLRGLQQWRPHYLHSYASYIELLSRAQLEGRLCIQPELISLGSEPAPARLLELVRRAFGDAEVRVTYGATECMAIANQCREGRLHLNSDACLIEPMDREGRPVPASEPSHHILLTNLINFAQPLIRYRVSDQVIVHTDPCPCGKPFAVMEVLGRSDDVLTLRRGDGRVLSCPPIPFELLFLGVEGLLQYQLIHERQNHLRVCLVRDSRVRAETVSERLRQRFDQWLKERGLDESVSYELSWVEAILRDAHSGKQRQIISQVASLPATDEEGRA